MQFADIFRGLSKCAVGDGRTCLFWSDFWNDNLRSVSHPRAFSYVKNQKDSVLQTSFKDLSQIFFLPLSEQAYQEYQAIQMADPLDQLSDDFDKCLNGLIFGAMISSLLKKFMLQILCICSHLLI